MRCSCGAWLTFPTDMPLTERDEQAQQFFKKHDDCRKAALKKSKALALRDIAATNK